MEEMTPGTRTDSPCAGDLYETHVHSCSHARGAGTQACTHGTPLNRLQTALRKDLKVK